MDTVKRQLVRGRQMRLHVGDSGVLPGITGFGCVPTLDVERQGEYDSDERILTRNTPEFSGNVEILYSERDDFWRALIGKDAGNLVDVNIANVGEAPIFLNIWNKRKTKFDRSAIVIRPTWTSLPHETSVDNVTTMRCEFQCVNFAMFPNHAIGYMSYPMGGTVPATPFSLSGSRTPVKLSRAFGGQYVVCVVNKVEDPSNPGDYDFNYLCVASSSASSFTIQDQTTEIQPNSEVFAFFAYVSVAEAGGYICQTL